MAPAKNPAGDAAEGVSTNGSGDTETDGVLPAESVDPSAIGDGELASHAVIVDAPEAG